MKLHRTAFEDAEGVIRFTVLCTGCASTVLAKVRARAPGRRVWTKELIGPGSCCEFCVNEARRQAL